MIPIPLELVHVAGGLLRPHVTISVFSCLDDDPSRVIPRFWLERKLRKKNGKKRKNATSYFETDPIKKELLSCELDSVRVFNSLVGEGPIGSIRQEIVLDLALIKLIDHLEFDVRAFPIVTLKLVLKNAPDHVFLGEIEDTVSEYFKDFFTF